jgi:hypothetical protein
MDRTRRIDDFEMTTMAYDPAVLVLEAALAAERLADRIAGCPAASVLSAAAMALVHDQAHDEGFSVRTRLLVDNWLIYVRIDQRTGPAIVHEARPLPLLLAA